MGNANKQKRRRVGKDVRINMKMSSIIRGKDDGVLDQGSNSGNDEKLSFSGYIFNKEPRFTDRLYKGVKERSQRGLQVF